MAYYDYQRVLSYNATLNFIIGGRGVGKTYGAKKFVVKDAINNGNQFIYLRRYKSELVESSTGFFNGLIANGEFEGHKFEVKTSKNSMRFLCDGEEIGYGLTLSNAVIYKSREFPNVKTIIFDEFTIDKSTIHYLQNEVHAFLDIVETIGRTRDPRVFLLGNAVARNNPYFNYFKLDTPYNNDIKTYKDGMLLVQQVKNEEFADMKRQTKMGRIVEGTNYSDYAIGNKWLYECNTFIAKKPKNAKFIYIIKISDTNYGIWVDFRESKMYLSKDHDPSCKMIYVVDNNDHNENTTLARGNSSGILKTLINNYKVGKVIFESQKIKTAILPYINKYSN